MILLGLSGYQSAGKDTAGAYLAAHHGFEVVKFAEPLYASAAALLDVTPSLLDALKNDPEAKVILSIPQGEGAALGVRSFTIREYLQRYGTEAHREIFGRSFWTEQLMAALRERCIAENDPNMRFVATDCRFDNECAAVGDVDDGYVVRIERGERASDHPSEDPPPPELVDFVIDNEGTLPELYEALDRLVAEIEDRVAA